MNKKPVLLDLFACEGGATAGYQRAGFDVFAVDMSRPRLKRNPAEHALVGDALKVLDDLYVMGRAFFGDGASVELAEIALIHMSPPCQAFTRGNAGRETSWPKLIEPCRELTAVLDVPYVIENVKDAGPEMVDPVGLCGCMFDLSTLDTDGETIHLQRLRLFETGGFVIAPPRSCNHSAHKWVAGAYGGGSARQVRGQVHPQGRLRAPGQGRRQATPGHRARHDLERLVRKRAARLHRAHRPRAHGAPGGHMTRLDLARDNFAGLLLAWLDGEVGYHQLDAAASGYMRARQS